MTKKLTPLQEAQAFKKQQAEEKTDNTNEEVVIDSPMSDAEKFELAKKRRDKYKAAGQQNGFNLKLNAPARKGYKRRFANNIGGRLDELLNRGYTYVEDPSIDSAKPGKVCRRAGVDQSGNEFFAYLLEIPEDWYNEDYMRRQQDRVDSKEEAMKQSAEQGGTSYTPNEGIKIEHGTKQ